MATAPKALVSTEQTGPILSLYLLCFPKGFLCDTDKTLKKSYICRSSAGSFLRRGGSANSSFRKAPGSGSNPPMNLWRPVVELNGEALSAMPVNMSGQLMKARSSDSLPASPAAVHRYVNPAHSFRLQVPQGENMPQSPGRY